MPDHLLGRIFGCLFRADDKVRAFLFPSSLSNLLLAPFPPRTSKVGLLDVFLVKIVAIFSAVLDTLETL